MRCTKNMIAIFNNKSTPSGFTKFISLEPFIFEPCTNKIFVYPLSINYGDQFIFYLCFRLTDNTEAF
jgi:hypothetical protein